MFRSLATRLTATYVFAAIVLVVIVFASVTLFALSIFGIAARGTAEEVARQVPEEVRLELGRSGSLRAAAADISRHLSRPGLRVAVFEQDGLRRRFLAASFPGGSPGGAAIVVLGRTGDLAPREPGPPDLGAPGGPGSPGAPGASGGPEGPGGGSEPGAPPRGALTLGAPPGGFGPPDGFRHYERMAPYPLGLNVFLHLEPREVGVSGGTIVLVPDPGDLIRAVNAFWLAMLPIGLFVVAAAWLLGRYITGQALRPLVETTSSLRRFGDGDFTATAVTTTARDEIGELARAYNAAAAQVSSAFENRRAAEIEMRQFIADAGHELRTPLTVIMGFVDVLRRRSAGDPGTAKIFDTMQAESRRMKDLIDKLIVLARLENAPPRELETVDLAQIAGDVTTSLGALAGAAPIGLSVEPDALVRGYEGELQDAVSNLVENALKYAPQSPVEVCVAGDRSTVTLEVRDAGPGIPVEEQTQVFARFYRGREREDAEGFGLGLAIAKRAVERAGGTLSLESVPGEGCRFTMRIPRATRGERVSLAV